MKITMTKDVIKETFGEMKFMGMTIKRVYDPDSRLPEEEREISSVLVNLGAEKKNDMIVVALNPDENGKFQLPNVKKWGNVRFTNLVYDPRAAGNSMKDRSSGETRAWGTLNERFMADVVLPETDTDKLADENGEKMTKK
ncbi:hypothetical protein IA826_02240 [Listeria seeligeri]|uniref:hypothetical protein n=1 Tax=Listeria seeligeri TaxID=1640 RepID=UPI001628D881|nr:hypothetical protein [Listeria seeligeri]MBC2069882.1 hypothetical protein [Listeria seeligeri]MBC2087856.1 hypothetical protein [Listeria seeligeri]MBF2400550.1 hypothetical protein [Listeria seeligeri]MBF2499597.1 hypothetical protein [Listeria seeligeri]MBF2651835.1 hypothetical protein [Listeria seeligeri]